MTVGTRVKSSEVGAGWPFQEVSHPHTRTTDCLTLFMVISDAPPQKDFSNILSNASPPVSTVSTLSHFISSTVITSETALFLLFAFLLGRGLSPALLPDVSSRGQKPC